MYQRNALTLKELQSIQSLRDRSVAAAEKLLNIIIKQPDAIYLCFLDVVKNTGQKDIYDDLVNDGYKGQLSTSLSSLFAFFWKHHRPTRWPEKVSHYQEASLNRIKSVSKARFFISFDYKMGTTIL